MFKKLSNKYTFRGIMLQENNYWKNTGFVKSQQIKFATTWKSAFIRILVNNN